MTLRNKVIEDILIYNTNCYLSKNYVVSNKNTFNCKNVLFVDISYVGSHVSQFSVIEMQSPTKSYMLMNKYFKYSDEKNKRVEKLCCYSDINTNDAYDFINDFLTKSIYKNREVWMMSKIDSKIKVKQFSIYELIELEDEIKMMGYVANDNLKFSVDYDDAVVTNITKICKLSTKFKLI